MSTFENQVAIITGGRRGIGKAIALKLGKNGARIAFNDIGQPEEITKTVEEFRSEGIEAKGYLVDVTNRNEVQKMIEDIIKSWERIDILVNNAGITRDGLFLRMKDEDWQKVIEVCLQGTYNFTKEVLKYMVKQKYGRIINISSVVGVMGNAGQTNYSTAKAAILGFTKSLAREVAARGITVNAVAPGFIDTDMTRRLPEEVKKLWIDQIPMRRGGYPEDVAEAVAFLASKASGYITGQTIHVNGGMLML